MVTNLNKAVIYYGILTLVKVRLNYPSKYCGQLPWYFYKIGSGACIINHKAVIVAVW